MNKITFMGAGSTVFVRNVVPIMPAISEKSYCNM